MMPEFHRDVIRGACKVHFEIIIRALNHRSHWHLKKITSVSMLIGHISHEHKRTVILKYIHNSNWNREMLIATDHREFK